MGVVAVADTTDGSRTVAELLAELRRRLRSHRAIEPVARDAELLAAAALGVDHRELSLRRPLPVPTAAARRARQLAGRRARGEPLAYVLGTQEFHGLELEVDSAVLIPRPDTETLVEVIRSRVPPPGWVVDVGTGSGAICCALADAAQSAEETEHRFLGIDISGRALAVTRRNLRRLGLDRRIELVRSDLLGCLSARAAVAAVVSNPPYVERDEYWRLDPSVRDFEPEVALVPPDGADRFRRRLIGEASSRLRPGGLLALEVGAGQAGRAREDLLSAGYRRVRIDADLGGIGRVVSGRRPESPREPR